MPPRPDVTAREAMAQGARILDQAGVPHAEWDAELLLRHVLGWSRADLLARDREPLTHVLAERYRDLLAQRAQRRPLQHLTGRQAFWRHELVVTPDVLIPRPETELLVETVLDLIRGVASPLIIDVGTGSGCIALALATERPDARVVATDLSLPALTVAAANLERHGLRPRVRLVAGDLLAPFAGLAGQVHVVASNPPYVDPDALLAPEVREHEPAMALFPRGSEDSVYRSLVAEAIPLLAPGGLIALELGTGLESAVRRICEAQGLVVTHVRRDLQGHPRTLVARQP